MLKEKNPDFTGRSYHIITYGCQMNKNDTERMSGMLENIGFHESETWQEANLIVLNTCSIRDKAERRVVGKFHELNFHRKNHGKDMKLAIAGCMPQHAKDFLLNDLKFIDYIVGVNNMEVLPEFLTKSYSLEEQVALLRPHRRKAEEVASFEENLSRQKRKEIKKAWVSIMFGCDKFCTYCIVPSTRGREMSRKKEDIFKEIASLEEKGTQQIVLLGQNVNSYGLTTYEDYDFADLMEDIVNEFTWIEKLDFITSHPRDMNEKLIDVIAKYPRIAREIHFPSQHGDDEILRRMARNYTFSEYKKKVDLLRTKVPDVLIGTDIIVGFPGETEEQFNRLIETCYEIEYDFANTAAFSIRPGTRAATMKDQIPEKVKKERLLFLNKTLEEIYNKKGSKRPVLGALKLS